MNAAVDRNFSNDMIVMTVRTQVSGDELSDSSSRYLYKCFRVNLTTESVNTVAPQFVNNGLSIINTLNKSAGIWIPANRVKRSPDFTHCSTEDNTERKKAAVGDAVGEK